jgi:cyclase
MTTARVPEHVELPPPEVVEVSDGVFAYVQLDGSWGLNNAGFLVGRDGVTVIDTCFTERRSRAFRDTIASVAPGRAVRTLVNTHHHGDHTYGNYLFMPEATIIGHEKCREEVIATGMTTKGLFPGVQWGEIEIAPPFVTFEGRLNLYMDDLLVELIYVGPAHTTNDIVAWIPERKVLFAGDVVFNGGMPFVIMGSIEGSLRTLGRLRAMGAERIVPGHGPVCGNEVIDEVEAYLRFVQQAARKGFDGGAAPLEVARETDLGRFAALLDAERFAANLHRAYSELQGERLGTPLALGPVVADMVAYNGGQMPRCLA